MFEYYVPILRVDEGLLEKQLRDAALPVGAPVRRTLGGVLAYMLVELSAGQLATLESVVGAHTPRRPRARLAVAQDVFNLAADQRLKVLCAVAAVVLADHPQLARLLGVPFDADEPDPG